MTTPDPAIQPAPRTTPPAVQLGIACETSAARRAVLLVARLIVGALFVYAGWGKFEAPANFAKEIRNYKLAPVSMTNAMALVIPPLEIFTGILVVAGPFRREARMLLLVMLVVFTAAKGYSLANGMKLHCGCVPETSWLRFLFDGWTGFATNLVMIAILAVDWRLDRRWRPSRAHSPPALTAA